MTFDDDCIRLYLTVATPVIPLKHLGLEWPPPERITELGGKPLDPMIRTSMSAITDEQRARMSGVIVRGAEYRYEFEVKTLAELQIG